MRFNKDGALFGENRQKEKRKGKLLLLLSIFLRLQRTSVLHGSVTGGLTAPLQKTEGTGMNLPSPCGF